jgi:hypothetical protein
LTNSQGEGVFIHRVFKKLHVKTTAVIFLVLLLGLPVNAEDVAKDAISYIDWLLTPASNQLIEKTPSGSQGIITNAILHLRWVARSELLARKAFWQDYQKHPDPKVGVFSSETEEEFLFFDNSVCDYRQTVIQPGCVADQSVWRRWMPHDKGAEWHESMALQLMKSKDVLSTPTGTSWCVIMTYVHQGQLRVAHFYLPARIYVQTFLATTFRMTQECNGWHHRDDRFALADWMTKNLQYDRKIWESHD